MGARLAVYLLCFVSGVAGLAYEVIWLRLLAAALGNSTAATAAVLASVMGGMGVGAIVAGRMADRRDPLRLYGLLELALGLFALAVPWLVGAAGDASLPLLRVAGPGFAGGAVRFTVAAVVVFLPACVMGATVPVLVRFAELRSRDSGDPVGPSTAVIYGLNTAGAALGCGLTGFVLLALLGVRSTSALSAGLNIAVGLAALAMAALSGRPASRRIRAELVAPSAPGPAVLALALLSGTVVLGFETLWIRLLRVVLGHDVHAFASMLLALLVGLAAGAAGWRALPPRIRTSEALLPVLFVLVGMAGLLSFALAGRLYLGRGLDVLNVSAALSTARSHELGLALQVLFAAVLVLPPAIPAGAVLPALAARYRGRGETAVGPEGGGSRVGAVLGANTAGAILGSLAVPFLLVPALGLQRAFVAVAAVAALSAVVAVWAARPSPSLGWSATLAAVAALALAALPAPHGLPLELLARKIGPRHLVFELYEEGRTGTVAVVRNRINGERQLFVNGVNQVTTRLVHDQSFKLLGHLGLLLHPEPRRVVVICLGAGISAGAAASHGSVETIEIVDIERSVVGAARRFGRLNNMVLDDPRVRVLVDDGRNHLRVSPGGYDVVVVDSTHPRAVDSWLLYTREFYQAAWDRLAERGFLVQWLPLHGLSVDEFRIVVGTFLDAFPEGSLWVNSGFEPYGQASYALLLGPRGEAGIDLAALERSLAEESVRRDLDPWGLFTPAEVLECFVAGPDALRRWTGHLPANTDDLPWSQLVTRYSRAAPMTAGRLLEVREPVIPHLAPEPGEALASDLRRRYRAQGFLLAGLLGRAVEVCGPTCEKPPMFVDEVAEGPGYFIALRSYYPDDPERLLEIANGLRELGSVVEAVETLEMAVAHDRIDPRLWLNLGLARVDRGDAGGAEEAFRSAIALNPEMALARLGLGLLLLRTERVEAGLGELARAVALASDLAETHAALGFGLMHATEELALARAHLERALVLDPRNLEARVSLGRLALRVGRDADAVEAFVVARRLYPFDVDVLFNLGVALARTGRAGRARAALEAARSVAPDDPEVAAALRQLDRGAPGLRPPPPSPAPPRVP